MIDSLRLSLCIRGRDSKDKSQESGGLLLAAGLDGGDTFIFAGGENVNESLPVYQRRIIRTISQWEKGSDYCYTWIDSKHRI